MAVTKVNICNQALIFLGEKTIISLDDETRQGELCSTFFDNTRETMLRQHPWNFALKRKLLTQDTTNPAWEWQKQYILPADYLRIINVYPLRMEYAVEGNRLLCNESEVGIKYIYNNTDYNSWTPDFAQLVAARLAVLLTHTITDKSSLTQQAMAWYKESEKMAKGIESQEGSTEQINSDTFIDARWRTASSQAERDNIP